MPPTMSLSWEQNELYKNHLRHPSCPGAAGLFIAVYVTFLLLPWSLLADPALGKQSEVFDIWPVILIDRLFKVTIKSRPQVTANSPWCGFNSPHMGCVNDGRL